MKNLVPPIAARGLMMACFLALRPLSASADAAVSEIVIDVHKISAEGVGESIGSVKAVDTKFGLLFTPDLKELSPGLHGFHIHQNPSCEPDIKDGKPQAGIAAGGHFDPAQSEAHSGPYHNGHLGDLPPLFAAGDGRVTLPVLAPRLKLADIKGRSVMIHEGGDNFSDTPDKLGGGGARVACGVVK